MPFQLDDYDVSIIKSLMKDGRKSFREISRLANIGFIESVSPIFDFGVVEEAVLDNRDRNNNAERDKLQNLQQQSADIKSRIKRGVKIKLDCEFCKGPIVSYPHVFKFANYERFFCCAVCMLSYKQKYAGRIESIVRKFEGKESQ